MMQGVFLLLLLLQMSPTESRLLPVILCADFTTLQGFPVCLKLEKTGVKAGEKFVSKMGGEAHRQLFSPICIDVEIVVSTLALREFQFLPRHHGRLAPPQPSCLQI